jgi:hypothetical protein
LALLFSQFRVSRIADDGYPNKVRFL